MSESGHLKDLEPRSPGMLGAMGDSPPGSGPGAGGGDAPAHSVGWPPYLTGRA